MNRLVPKLLEVHTAGIQSYCCTEFALIGWTFYQAIMKLAHNANMAILSAMDTDILLLLLSTLFIPILMKCVRVFVCYLNVLFECRMQQKSRVVADNNDNDDGDVDFHSSFFRSFFLQDIYFKISPGFSLLIFHCSSSRRWKYRIIFCTEKDTLIPAVNGGGYDWWLICTKSRWEQLKRTSVWLYSVHKIQRIVYLH